MSADPRPVTVYRLFDADERLLYVGCTVNLKERFKDHRATKDWFREVARTDVDHFQNREEGLAAELAAIRTEDPIYNFRGKEGDKHFTPRELAYLGRSPAAVSRISLADVEARLRAAEAPGQ